MATLDERIAVAEAFADLMYAHGSRFVYEQALRGVEALKRQREEEQGRRP